MGCWALGPLVLFWRVDSGLPAIVPIGLVIGLVVEIFMGAAVCLPGAVIGAYPGSASMSASGGLPEFAEGRFLSAAKDGFVVGAGGGLLDHGSEDALDNLPVF